MSGSMIVARVILKHKSRPFHSTALKAYAASEDAITTPIILKNSQSYVQQKFQTNPNPIDFVFHGGSGSSVEEIREAIGYGVIKMNIDTDTQWAFWEGILGFYKANEAYLQGQIGNPTGDDSPNKKDYDPRVWLRKGEETLVARLKTAFEDLNATNANQYL
jgi:fructose-bisphosphate aldolase class II